MPLVPSPGVATYLPAVDHEPINHSPLWSLSVPSGNGDDNTCLPGILEVEERNIRSAMPNVKGQYVTSAPQTLFLLRQPLERPVDSSLPSSFLKVRVVPFSVRTTFSAYRLWMECAETWASASLFSCPAVCAE